MIRGFFLFLFETNFNTNFRSPLIFTKRLKRLSQTMSVLGVFLTGETRPD